MFPGWGIWYKAAAMRNPTSKVTVFCQGGKTNLSAELEADLIKLTIDQVDGKHKKTVTLAREDAERLITHLRWAMPYAKMIKPSPFASIADLVVKENPEQTEAIDVSANHVELQSGGITAIGDESLPKTDEKNPAEVSAKYD